MEDKSGLLYVVGDNPPRRTTTGETYRMKKGLKKSPFVNNNSTNNIFYL
jgi:hypothetical protein